MKKVRLAVLGAVGMTPALGLTVIPSATAAAADQAPNRPAKTVSLEHPAAAAVACIGHDATRAHSGNFHISVYHTPSTSCVGGVSASLLSSCTTGLLLRTRAYSISKYGTKTRYFDALVGGHITGCKIASPQGSIEFYQGIHQTRAPKEQVCDAIVFASKTDRVWRGPVCVSF